MTETIAKTITRFLFRNGYSNPTSVTPGKSRSLLQAPLKAWRALEVLRGVYFDRRFDRKHGVDTAGAIYLRELTINSNNIEHGELYDPFPYRSFKHVMKFLPNDVSQHTFVDYGSGKGRLLLVASDYPFRRVIGVEFSKQLCAAAESNIAAYNNSKQQCFKLESLNMDAVEFEPPAGPCALFFFAPFGGEVLDVVLHKIRQSFLDTPRPMTVLFVTDSKTHPMPWDQFEKTGVMEPVRSGILPFDPARRYPIQYAVLELQPPKPA